MLFFVKIFLKEMEIIISSFRELWRFDRGNEEIDKKKRIDIKFISTV